MDVNKIYSLQAVSMTVSFSCQSYNYWCYTFVTIGESRGSSSETCLKFKVIHLITLYFQTGCFYGGCLSALRESSEHCMHRRCDISGVWRHLKIAVTVQNNCPLYCTGGNLAAGDVNCCWQVLGHFWVAGKKMTTGNELNIVSPTVQQGAFIFRAVPHPSPIIPQATSWAAVNQHSAEWKPLWTYTDIYYQF